MLLKNQKLNRSRGGIHFLYEFTEDMVAAGTSPDMNRVQAPEIPGLLVSKLLFDLMTYFEANLDTHDLAAVNLYYRAERALKIGLGKYCDIVKVYSPDGAIFANSALFEDSGLPIRTDTEALTYDQVMALSEETTVFEGDQMLQYGYGYENDWVDRFWMVILGESGQNLYSYDYAKIILLDNPDTLEIIK